MFSSNDLNSKELNNHNLNNKLYYSIAELASILDEKQHVVRYWEQKFTELKPHKRNSSKYYTNKQVELFKIVKNLIREEHLTLAGAKKSLKDYIKKNRGASSPEDNYINKDSTKIENKKDNIVLSKEEFIELLETLQLLMLYVQAKK